MNSIKYFLGIIFISLSCTAMAQEERLDIKPVSNKDGSLTVQGEVIVEIKRGEVDLGEEKGIVPYEKAGIKSETLNALNRKYGLLSIERLFSGTRSNEPSDIYVFRFPREVNIDEVVAAYRSDAGVFYVEPNYMVYAEERH